MAENSGIQWTDSTFNGWRGCERISPGCDMCYAEALSRRNPKVMGVWGSPGTRVIASDSMWREPLKWNDRAYEEGKIRRVFAYSLADVFEEWIGYLSHPNGEPSSTTMEGARMRLWDLMRRTCMLRWMLLTKRTANIPHMLPGEYRRFWDGVDAEVVHAMRRDPAGFNVSQESWPARIWLGTTVEDQQRAEERIPLLTAIPATVHFLSCEPLLGPVDLAPHLAKGGIQWVIVGGESSQGGQRARPFDLGWAEEIVNDCRRFKVPVFVKQLGSRPVAEGLGILNRQGDRHGGTLEDWPEWLRVREIPEG